jgi:hypothetical protein
MTRTEETATPLRPVTSELVCYRKPDGFILSTGNLYFTYHDDATASVWRAAQSAVPGQEILLYSEPGAQFGDIVFAEVDGTWWGYFFSASAGATITIKRVPLTGGAATDLATLTDIDIANSHRNLVTDGENLYWQDVSSVRMMPIRGGAVIVLDQASPNTPTAGLALQNGNLIYASVADIRYVPTSGATNPPSERTIVTASQRVTTLHAVLSFVYWGDENGAIWVVDTNNPDPGTIVSNGGVPTSISTSVHGGVYAQAWTMCDSESCRLHIDVPSGEYSDYDIDGDALGVSIASSGDVFWGDDSGVHRYTPRITGSL